MRNCSLFIPIDLGFIGNHFKGDTTYICGFKNVLIYEYYGEDLGTVTFMFGPHNFNGTLANFSDGNRSKNVQMVDANHPAQSRLLDIPRNAH